ncbi:hypothetical protein D3C80_1690490 [compost metagenome]
MQHAQRALIGLLIRIVRLFEKMLRKAQPERKTGKQFHAQLPALRFKAQHGFFKRGQFLFVWPQRVHQRTGDLVGLFLIRRAGRRAHLRFILPARVTRQRILRFYRVGQREEILGHAEGLTDIAQRDTVIADLKEADFDGCTPEFVGDLTFTVFKI